MKHSFYDAVVIGGGFFGCRLALDLKKHFKNILICEQESNLLQRASYVNQARVHNGYHYPRSLLTALRSRVNFPKFINEYQECIDSSFDKYYAIGKILSKVTAQQFKLFCERINAPIETATRDIKKLFNCSLIEEVFITKEYAFDTVKLRDRMFTDLENTAIEVELSSKVLTLEKQDDFNIKVLVNTGNEERIINAKYVFNCTYSGINKILINSELPTIPLKHELTEMALVEVPDPLKYMGVTVMCGPFFSIMPFPSRGLHTLSHVRYTPHCYWQDLDSKSYIPDELNQIIRQTNYPHMLRDVQRYIPILQECSYVESLWEIKTVLPQSEVNDSRPILFRKDQGIKNLICILGGKIDNIYDVHEELYFLNYQESSK